MNVNKNDEKVRRALYECYMRRSFYTNEPIDYMDMEVDHILPESLEKDEVRFKEICTDYGLENFKLNSLYNLVPTNKYENRTKSNGVFDKSTILFYLQRAKEKVPEIERRIKENKDKFKYERNLSGMMDYINNQNNKEYEIEKLLNYIDSKDDVFKEYEEIYKFDSLDSYREKEIFKKYTKRIGIEIILPQYDDCETKCIIYFKTIKLRDCKIILDNKFILSRLFKGLETDPKYGLRGFISYDKDILNELNKDETKYFKLSLGNNEVELCTEDIYALCEVIDRIAKVYIERIKEIENILGVEKFPISKNRNSYKIAILSGKDLEKIFKFIKYHDTDYGKEKWDIFDSRQTSNIAIYTEGSNYLDDGYHSFFFIEKNEETIYYPLGPNNDYIITWRFIQDSNNSGIEYINDKETWNGMKSYNWFVNEFLKEVMKKNMLGRMKERKLKRINKVLGINTLHYIRYIELEKVISHYKFCEVIGLLQRFFHKRSNEIFRIDIETFKGLYTILLNFTKRSNHFDSFYICDKLKIKKNSSKEDVIEEINNRMIEYEEKNIYGRYLDCINRVLLIIIRDNSFKLSKDEVNKLIGGIRYIVQAYNDRTLLDKYAIDFIDM